MGTFSTWPVDRRLARRLLALSLAVVLLGTLSPAAVHADPTDATLSALTLLDGNSDPVAFSPAFNSGVSAYTSTVANTVSSVRVKPVVNDAGASAKVNGEALAGDGSVVVALAVGDTSITIVVTAADLGTFQYVASVHRRSSNSLLATLAHSSTNVTLSTGVFAYSETVAYTATSATITAVPQDVLSTMTLGGGPLASGVPSASQALAIGSNVFTVVVTAEDSNTSTYTLELVRLPAPVPAISDIGMLIAAVMMGLAVLVVYVSRRDARNALGSR